MYGMNIKNVASQVEYWCMILQNLMLGVWFNSLYPDWRPTSSITITKDLLLNSQRHVEGIKQSTLPRTQIDQLIWACAIQATLRYPIICGNDPLFIL